MTSTGAVHCLCSVNMVSIGANVQMLLPFRFSRLVRLLLALDLSSLLARLGVLLLAVSRHGYLVLPVGGARESTLLDHLFCFSGGPRGGDASLW